RKHLHRHGNDPERSLAAVGSSDPLRGELAKISDQEVAATLSRMPAGPPAADATFSTHGAAAAPADGERFRILRPYRQGGLGAVYIARDQELHREVALKKIQDRHADDPTSRARFLLEAEVTGRLEHPGIVPVYSLGRSAD